MTSSSPLHRVQSGPTSFRIETGEHQTSTQVDGVKTLVFDEYGVTLTSDEGVKAFAPYGSFLHIKEVAPKAQPATTISAQVIKPCACRQVLTNVVRQTGR